MIKKIIFSYLVVFSFVLPQDTTVVISSYPVLFTLDTKDPLVEWVFPDGGESFESGSTITGEWNAEDDSFDETPVSVYLSTSIGGSFDPLIVGIPNNSNAAFELPEANTAYARMFITVMDDFGNTAQDYGDDEDPNWRVWRGGSCGNESLTLLLSYYRIPIDYGPPLPGYYIGNIGFRLVRTINR